MTSTLAETTPTKIAETPVTKPIFEPINATRMNRADELAYYKKINSSEEKERRQKKQDFCQNEARKWYRKVILRERSTNPEKLEWARYANVPLSWRSQIERELDWEEKQAAQRKERRKY